MVGLMYSLQKEVVYKNELHSMMFMEEVLDSMFDWVRVIDMGGVVVFMNRAMRSYYEQNADEASFLDGMNVDDDSESFTDTDLEMISTALHNNEHDKEIAIGNKVFAVISSPLKSEEGKTEFIVEVFRDVTRLKNLQHTIIEQNKKFEYDLDMAKMLQRKLLPKASPNPRIDFSYLYKPCDMLGGDFIDMYNIGSDHLGVYIADVSGHGVSASILTVFLRSTISKRLTSPAEALNTLYKEFCINNFESEVYITVFYAIYDFKKGIITYSNAGHNAMPVLYNKHNRQQQNLLQMPGIPISNWMDSTVYQEQTVKVEPGDLLFLFTDGLSEIKNREKEMFGQNRINDLLIHSPYDNHQLMLEGIVDEAYSFGSLSSKSMQDDDITLSFVELK